MIHTIRASHVMIWEQWSQSPLEASDKSNASNFDGAALGRYLGIYFAGFGFFIAETMEFRATHTFSLHISHDFVIGCPVIHATFGEIKRYLLGGYEKLFNHNNLNFFEYSITHKIKENKEKNHIHQSWPMANVILPLPHGVRCAGTIYSMQYRYILCARPH